MATEPSTTVEGSPEPVMAGYEPRDADVRWIFSIVAGLMCCGIIIHFALLGIIHYLLRSPASTDAWRPIRLPQSATKAPQPRLQVSPALELQQFRAWEDQQLTSYGWVNRTANIVHVPIERAIDLVLQKGLPIRTNLAQGKGPSSVQLVEERLLQRQTVQPKQK